MSSPAQGNSVVSQSSVVDQLSEMALDLRWSYHHAADELWRRLDADLWESTHNPWVVLQTISQARLKSVTADPSFQQLLGELRLKQQHFEQTHAWFQKAHPNAGISTIAYFSMEFMLSEALPIYSGGLGNVAGDQLKTASSLGVPVAGVSLLYQQGYFRQEIDAQGQQQALYPFNDPGQLPITPLRDANGEWLRLSLDFPGGKLWVRTWQAKVGRTKLYLLDTNDPANPPEYRGISSELYGGGPELRLKQEFVLGIGGWRLLRALGLQPEVCHLNEGHAAFAVLERARSHAAENKQPFDLALAITRAGNLFTTHTPVGAGFDRFAPDLMTKYFKHYAEQELSIGIDHLIGLGRQNPNDASEPFNMAYLAVRGSGAVNGVSRLHGEVSRRIFQSLFPRWPEIEVPIGYVTNGVHASTWDSAVSDRVWEAAGGKHRWHDATVGLEDALRKVSDSDFWQLRSESRKTVVDYVRSRYSRQLARHAASADEIAQAEQIFDADTLTLGFARRFASYKRPNLLLRDPERLARILTNGQTPVQLVLAGKAHPQDGEGQWMIRQWIEFSRRPDVKSRVVFLSDYDLLMAEHLVQGVDLWINTPRRPWEASGTSGMKVLVNGGLNLSELDGWWAEAYSPQVGWAIGDGREHSDTSYDGVEADALYGLLEREVIPEFYRRDDRGIARGWVARMRESMATLTPRFSTNRVVRQYTDDFYLAAASAFKERAAKGGALGADILKWQSELANHWSMVRFGSATAEQKGSQYEFRVQVFVDDLEPDAAAVEVYAAWEGAKAAESHALVRGDRLVGAENGFTYSATIPATRPLPDYTPRLIPQHAGAHVPLEAPFILWHDSPSWR
jgi:starch phosphorylase